MRVSSHFNWVAGPLLYRDFTLENPTVHHERIASCPDGTPFHSSKWDWNGKIPSKEENMRHARMVTVIGQFKWSTRLANDFFPRFSAAIAIPVMRIELPASFWAEEWSPGTSLEPVPESYPFIALWERLLPKKLVMIGNVHRWDDIQTLPPGIECMVIHFDCLNAAQYASRYHALKTCPTLKKIIFIISDAAVNLGARSSVEDDSWQWWTDPQYSRLLGLNALRQDCQQAAENQEFKGEIIVVNSKGVGRALSESRDAAFPADVRNKIQYLTTDEYIASHDTTGEFPVTRTLDHEATQFRRMILRSYSIVR